MLAIASDRLLMTHSGHQGNQQITYEYELMLGIAGLIGVCALLVFVQYFFDMDLHEIFSGVLLLVLASAMFLSAFAGDGPRWAAFSLAGLLALLAIIPFWRGYRERSSGNRRKSVADKRLYFYSWLALIVVLFVIRLATL